MSDLEYGLTIIIVIFLFYVFFTVVGRGYLTGLDLNNRDPSCQSLTNVSDPGFGCNIYTRVKPTVLARQLGIRLSPLVFWWYDPKFGVFGGNLNGGSTISLRKERTGRRWFCGGYPGKIYDATMVYEREYMNNKKAFDNGRWEKYEYCGPRNVNIQLQHDE
jgi:hypothetical protein